MLSVEHMQERAAQEAAEGPQPGEVYRHYRGGLYVVMARAFHVETKETLIVYRSNANGLTWARTLADFEREVTTAGYVGRRFVRVPD